MWGIYSKDHSERIGSIWKVMGEPKLKRWVAHHATGSKGFPTMKAARDWLIERQAEGRKKKEAGR